MTWGESKAPYKVTTSMSSRFSQDAGDLHNEPNTEQRQRAPPPPPKKKVVNFQWLTEFPATHFINVATVYPDNATIWGGVSSPPCWPLACLVIVWSRDLLEFPTTSMSRRCSWPGPARAVVSLDMCWGGESSITRWNGYNDFQHESVLLWSNSVIKLATPTSKLKKNFPTTVFCLWISL